MKKMKIKLGLISISIFWFTYLVTLLLEANYSFPTFVMLFIFSIIYFIGGLIIQNTNNTILKSSVIVSLLAYPIHFLIFLIVGFSFCVEQSPLICNIFIFYHGFGAFLPTSIPYPYYLFSTQRSDFIIIINLLTALPLGALLGGFLGWIVKVMKNQKAITNNNSEYNDSIPIE
ncbi:MAG: hypothetical protein ACI83O_000608 [Patescibacteria group bacterium]|jgi:hypothetical protein